MIKTLYKVGAWSTSGGHEVKIYSIDAGGTYPIIGAIKLIYENAWWHNSWTAEGISQIQRAGSNFDLLPIMVETEKALQPIEKNWTKYFGDAMSFLQERGLPATAEALRMIANADPTIEKPLEGWVNITKAQIHATRARADFCAPSNRIACVFVKEGEGLIQKQPEGTKEVKERNCPECNGAGWIKRADGGGIHCKFCDGYG